MSSEELINAYTEGRISRRTLIRRLVAAGVSLGAAVSYAHLLAPQAGAARRHGPAFEYPKVHLRIKSSDLHDVIRDERLVVVVRVSDTGGPKAELRLIATTRDQGETVLLGRRKVTFREPGRKRFRIEIDVGPLRHRNSAQVKVEAVSREGTAFDPTDPTVASDVRVLT